MPMQIMDFRLQILIGPSIWLLIWVSTPRCLPAFLTQTGFKYFCDVLGSLCRFLLSFHNKRAWRPPEQAWTGTFRAPLWHCPPPSITPRQHWPCRSQWQRQCKPLLKLPDSPPLTPFSHHDSQSHVVCCYHCEFRSQSTSHTSHSKAQLHPTASIQLQAENVAYVILL